MAGPSSIEWTDATWNPVTGCTKVSPGCDHCYAEGIARRFAGTKAFPDGFAVTVREDRLFTPMGWVSPRRVFVNSMSDLFHPGVPEAFITLVFAVMAGTPRHTYQILTKRHARMRALVSSPALRTGVLDMLTHWGEEDDTRFGDLAEEVQAGNWPLRNVWLGVSVESQQWANIRIPALVATPAAVRFVSAEPLLGPVDLGRWLRPTPGCGHVADDGGCAHPAAPHAPECHTGVTCPFGAWRGVDWVICGGESGPGARPMHPDWARGLRDQCQTTGVAFFFKQWGQYAPVNPDARGEAVRMIRATKKHTGRVLDGRTWGEFPGGER